MPPASLRAVQVQSRPAPLRACNSTGSPTGADGRRRCGNWSWDPNDPVTAENLGERWHELDRAVAEFAARNPQVENIGKFHRRIRRDLRALAALLPQVEAPPSSPDSAAASPGASPHWREECESPPGARDALAAAEAADSEQKRAASIEGFVNNLRGLSAEFHTVLHAPRVVGVSKTFSAVSGGTYLPGGVRCLHAAGSSESLRIQPGEEAHLRLDDACFRQAVWESAALQEARSDATASGGGGSSRSSKVEVDVVAQNGHAWIEVKALQGPMLLDSTAWQGRPGHIRGLRQQIQDRLLVAACPSNLLRFCRPQVVIYFPSGLCDEAAQEIARLGAIPISGAPAPVAASMPRPQQAVGPAAAAWLVDPPMQRRPPGSGIACRADEASPGGAAAAAGAAAGELDVSKLPPVPQEPSSVNLDVTAMCALCAEAAHLDLQDPALDAWAGANKHWAQFVALERAGPRLMQLVEPILVGKQLIASEWAVKSFEALLARFGGRSETARWQQLKSMLLVYPLAESRTQRVDALQHLPQGQRAVLGLSDARRALTMTANARALQRAASAGVLLEGLVHHAAWLMGR